MENFNANFVHFNNGSSLNLGEQITQSKGERHIFSSFKSETFGEVAFLDNVLFLQNIDFMRSELVAHIAACTQNTSLPNEPRKVLLVNCFDLRLGAELLAHSDIEIDFLAKDEITLNAIKEYYSRAFELKNGLENELKNGLESAANAAQMGVNELFANKRFNHLKILSNDFFKEPKNAKKYDIVIIYAQCDSAYFAELRGVLKENGILICKVPNLAQNYFENSQKNKIDSINIESSIESMRNLIESLGDFSVKMPFFVPFSPILECFIFASFGLHPLADISLDRADLLENPRFYNAAIHNAAFALPEFLRRALLGIARN